MFTRTAQHSTAQHSTAISGSGAAFVSVGRWFGFFCFYVLTALFVPAVQAAQNNEVKTAVDEYAELPLPVKNALLAAVQKPANDNIWVCESGELTACIAAKTVPPKNAENYSRIHALSVSQTNVKAFAAMCEHVAFKEKRLLKRFNDKELLRIALKHINISGSVKGALHKTQTIGSAVITIAYCPSANIKASLDEPENIENLAEQYLQAGHRKIKEASAKKDYREAVQTWKHLKAGNLFSPPLVADIAECYAAMNEPEECIRHCKEYGQYYKDINDKAFFIQLGNVLANIQSEESESPAMMFYDRAEQLFQIKRIKAAKQESP